MNKKNHMTRFTKCKLVEEFCNRFPEFKIVTKRYYANALYPVGSVVAVTNDLPGIMGHFPCGFIGVVSDIHLFKFGINEAYEYHLIILDYNGLPINTSGWYQENHLKLVTDTGNYGDKVIIFKENNI